MTKLNIAKRAFGGLTLLLGLTLVWIFPSQASLSEGFQTPIIAFEFARDMEDLSFLAGQQSEAVQARNALRLGLYWDMLFPIAYAGFLATLLASKLPAAPTIARLGLACTILIVPADIHENLVMLSLLQQAAILEISPALITTLHWATWLKWVLLGVSIACLAILMHRHKQLKTAALGIVTTILMIVTMLSDSMALLCELMSLSVFVFFIASVVLAFKETSSGPKISASST